MKRKFNVWNLNWRYIGNGDDETARAMEEGASKKEIIEIDIKADANENQIRKELINQLNKYEEDLEIDLFNFQEIK